jgi:hypothetical protein
VASPMTKRALKAFENLKIALYSETVIVHPRLDRTFSLIVGEAKGLEEAKLFLLVKRVKMVTKVIMFFRVTWLVWLLLFLCSCGFYGIMVMVFMVMAIMVTWLLWFLWLL